MLKPNLFDYNDAYILRGDINIIGSGLPAEVGFKNCAPLIKGITKIDESILDDAEDLDLIMLMFDLLEYGSDYSDTTGSLLFYSKDEKNNFNTNIEDSNAVKSFKYRSKLLENTEPE